MSESSIAPTSIELHDEIEVPFPKGEVVANNESNSTTIKSKEKIQGGGRDTSLAQAVMSLSEEDRQSIDDSIVSSVNSKQDRDTRLQIFCWKVQTLLLKQKLI
ncbi:hypothetical protein [Leptospira licerasiae]|uniref:Uncharacterized protein n=1 Tax=Leptospira licerasiae str. MMD4847 TaxID=1049971 RepID=A0ABP2RD29_9LEPT|nr:hypothetical protein [Leptospira licerasiae]EIE01488.1 hypothetical protein LEP1GSC185_3914 [Leptospira licerasiae serovar Varillal str. VAR 010]EJZ42340.1 hypothetical protein LEP1GSC178_0079 [Leptospira licerasiae str. MMD4847]